MLLPQRLLCLVAGRRLVDLVRMGGREGMGITLMLRLKRYEERILLLLLPPPLLLLLHLSFLLGLVDALSSCRPDRRQPNLA